MEFIIGGYYLVQGIKRPGYMDEHLIPSTFWSVSRCICEILPDAWIFTWTTDSTSSRREHYREILRQDEVSFHQMQREFDKLLDDGEFGFPNVFFSLALARNFYSKYLRHLPDVKLLSIALPKDYWEAFIREFAPVGNVAENGVRQKLRARCPLEPEASFRGFEILGHDYASFCSFVCHALEGDYDKALGIALNTNGLINSYQDAVRAADYTMLDEVGAEPLLWQPWLISEYALKARLSVRKQKG